jgi:hypothetical protein
MEKHSELQKLVFILNSPFTILNYQKLVPGGVEPPTKGLGNPYSIHLSYGTIAIIFCLRL